MSFSTFDHACMAEALRLARRGLYTTHPNPRVGCVIAADGEVVGRGWHERAGGPHAEHVAWCRAAYAQMLFHAGRLEAEPEMAFQPEVDGKDWEALEPLPAGRGG